MDQKLCSFKYFSLALPTMFYPFTTKVPVSPLYHLELSSVFVFSTINRWKMIPDYGFHLHFFIIKLEPLFIFRPFLKFHFCWVFLPIFLWDCQFFLIICKSFLNLLVIYPSFLFCKYFAPVYCLSLNRFLWSSFLGVMLNIYRSLQLFYVIKFIYTFPFGF